LFDEDDEENSDGEKESVELVLNQSNIGDNLNLQSSGSEGAADPVASPSPSQSTSALLDPLKQQELLKQQQQQYLAEYQKIQQEQITKLMQVGMTLGDIQYYALHGATVPSVMVAGTPSTGEKKKKKSKIISTSVDDFSNPSTEPKESSSKTSPSPSASSSTASSSSSLDQSLPFLTPTSIRTKPLEERIQLFKQLLNDVCFPQEQGGGGGEDENKEGVSAQLRTLRSLTWDSIFSRILKDVRFTGIVKLEDKKRYFSQFVLEKKKVCCVVVLIGGGCG
jgi:hypothetical protein